MSDIVYGIAIDNRLYGDTKNEILKLKSKLSSSYYYK